MKILSLFVLTALAAAPWPALADNSDSLVISQVQVSGPMGANDEFIEIHNPTSSTVNLNGWSVQYKSSTGGYPLTSRKALADFDLEPGKYFLIAHNSYFGNIAADLSHSAFTLSGSATGATIFLSKSSDYITGSADTNIVDRLGYGTSATNNPEEISAALPESGKSLLRITDAGNNSTDFVVGDSAPRNSATVALAEEESEETDENIDEDNEEVQVEETIEYPDGVIISELMPNPEGVDSGEEWIELYNSSLEAINLEGWILDDLITSEVSSKHLELGDVQIEPSEYLVIVIPEGKFTLNNTSEEQVKLYWPNKQEVNAVLYSGSAKEEQTWCLIEGDYQWCKSTPNKANAVIEVVKTTKKTAKPKTDKKPDTTDYSDYNIVLLELVPDPEGADSGNEIVKLANIGTVAVNLKGWILDDGLVGEPIGSSAYTIASGNLQIGDELEIKLPAGRFAMNNTGSDTVRLFSPDKKLSDYVTYESPEEGWFYVKSGDEWNWSGEVLGDSTEEGNVTTLPRTGMNIHMFSFATLVGIWYIVYGFRITKGIHEQTRSHRCLSS